jgi:hypothetical protein
MRMTLGRLVVMTLAALLTGCGGGGGGSTSPAASLELLAGAPPDGSGPTGGYVDGVGSAARFSAITDLTVGNDGTVYVVDAGNRKLRKITPTGMVTTLASFGDSPLTSLSGIAIDQAGNLFVARWDECLPLLSGCIRHSEIDRIDPSGSITPTYAVSSADRSGNCVGMFDGAIAAAPNGDLYFVADTFLINFKVPAVTCKLSTSAEVAIVGGGRAAIKFDAAGTMYSTEPGYVYVGAAGTSAFGPFAFPLGLAIDSAGDIYFSDIVEQVIRKISPTGAITVVSGMQGVAGYTTGPLPGLLTRPGRMALQGRDLYFVMGDAVMVIRNVP